MKAMWDQRLSLFGWGSALALLVFLETTLWPSMKNAPGMDAYLESLPAGMQELFALDEMSSARGFLNAELFTLLLPALFIVYGVSRAARMIAGEEERGTLELLLVTPLSTSRLLLEQAAALVSAMVVLATVTFMAVLGGSMAFGLGLTPADVASGVVALGLLGTEFGVLGLATGAVTGRRAWAIGLPAGACLAGYILHIGGAFSQALEPWRPWSPFYQVLHEGPLGGGLPASYLIPFGVTVAVLLAVLPLWARRDIGVH
jgi:ABC-2 type transport system permease protein